MTNHYVVTFNEANNRLEVPQGADGYLFDGLAFFQNDLTFLGDINSITPAEWSLGWSKLAAITLTVGPYDLDAFKVLSDNITVTQAVDLDAIEARVNALDASVVLMGGWNASTALFPASTNAGESWVCVVAGTVDGIPFSINDRIVALVDGAPNNSYAGNWLHLDYNDLVSSVAGKTGVVTLVEADITDLQAYILPTDIDTLAKLNGYVGETLMTEESIDTLAELNAVLTDATLDDSGDSRPPTAHTHGFVDLTTFPLNKSYTFSSRTANSGTYHLMGAYTVEDADANLTDGSPTVVLGQADHPYGAHAFMVYGGGSTDGTNITITVSGTSIDEAGTRTAADSEVLYNGTVAALTVDDMFESVKKWIGQVTYTLTSDGTTFTCDFNYGFAKYEDFADQDFTLDNFEVLGLFNAADSGFDVEIIHHNDQGWTYAATGFVPGPAPVATLTVDNGTESDPKAGDQIAWKRSNIGVVVEGSGLEGLIARITTSVNNSVSYLNLMVGVNVNVP